MAKPGMTAITGRKPQARKISVRSISFALSGEEAPYPVYNFSGRDFIERPGHNPFADIVPTPSPGGDTAWGVSWGTSWGDSWGV